MWQEAFKLAMLVYGLTKEFPKNETFGLTSQMRRAVVSITSNIAEGFGRNGWKEKDQFYAIANGSLFELENQLLIGAGVGYIKEHSLRGTVDQLNITGRMLKSLMKVNKEKGERV